MYSLISDLFLSLLFDFCEAFSGVEAIVVGLHDSLILIVLSRSLDSSFSRKDLTREKQSYNVLMHQSIETPTLPPPGPTQAIDVYWPKILPLGMGNLTNIDTPHEYPRGQRGAFDTICCIDKNGNPSPCYDLSHLSFNKDHSIFHPRICNPLTE